MNGAALIHGDALALPLADNTVDAIITSPPYFALRSYQDDGEHYDGQIGSEPTPAEFLAALWAVSDECWRVLKPTGSMFVDLGDKYVGTGGTGRDPTRRAREAGRGVRALREDAGLRLLSEAQAGARTKSLMGLPWRYALGLTCPDPYRPGGGHQWVLRAEIIWFKPNGLPESVTDRVRRSHEQWFHFTKGPRYYAAVDEVREAHNDRAGPPSRMGNQAAMLARSDGVSREQSWAPGGVREYNPLGKLPGSVWTIPSEPLVVPEHLGVDHYAAFPQEWPRRLILGWTPSGICTACGEGRRPVVEKGLEHVNNLSMARAKAEFGAARDMKLTTVARESATITGYACACDVTLAPTTPAVVLDPFVGTGTVPMVARALGRYGIGVDLSRDYLRLATWRITSGHADKTTARTNRERQGTMW